MVVHDHNQARVGHGKLSLHPNAIMRRVAERNARQSEEEQGMKMDGVSLTALLCISYLYLISKNESSYIYSETQHPIN